MTTVVIRSLSHPDIDHLCSIALGCTLTLFGAKKVELITQPFPSVDLYS